MNSPISDKERQERMMQQLKRIDQFLKTNSRKFFQEYDNYNETLVQMREQLKSKEEEMRGFIAEDSAAAKEFRSVAEIDAEDGIATRLNMSTLALARIANPHVFNSLIKPRLHLQDLTHLSFRQIPWEADAILFITNPLLIFDLLDDFLKFRRKHSPFISLYITNRIARLLFRFTQFVLSYDQFEKVVRLTFLQAPRFDPFKESLVRTVQALCLEARDCVLDQERPVFLNDLRRLYMIFSRALLLSTMEGKYPSPEIKAVLGELTPVINLEPSDLQTDGMLEEFGQYHFTSSAQRPSFIEQYRQLQARDLQYSLEFLGHLHPTDRLSVLDMLYQQSKNYVLQMFLQLREYYTYHGADVPAHYKEVVQTLREIVSYSDVQRDIQVDPRLREQAFWNETLYLGELPTDDSALSLDEEVLNLLSSTPRDDEMTQEKIFTAFQQDPEGAKTSHYLFELARWPFCYLTVEFGKPYFQLLTLGELLLMEVSTKGRQDIINYLMRSGQLTQHDQGLLRQHLGNVSQFMKRVVQKWQLKQEKVNVYDAHNHLRLYDFKQSLQNLREVFRVRFPDFLLRCASREFLLGILHEIERWLARQKNLALQQLAPEAVLQFLDNDEAWPMIESLRSSIIGRRYTHELTSALQRKDWFRRQLITMHNIKQRTLEYERARFVDPQAGVVSQTTGTTEAKVQDASVSGFFLPHQVRIQVFQNLEKNPEEKQPLFLELARTPFRFAELEFGKPRYIIFTLAETVAMNMGGQERRALLEFLVVTRQINQAELGTFKKHMVPMLMFIKQMCQRLQWGKTRCIWPETEGKLDFGLLSRLLVITDRTIRKQIRPLIVPKDHTQVLMEAVSEVQRWIARKENKAITDLTPQQVLAVLGNLNTANQVFQQLKTTPFGRQYLENVTLDRSSLEALCQELIQQYQLNVRLLQYLEQYPAPH